MWASVLWLVLVAFAGHCLAQSPPECARVSQAACDLHRALERGINLGNMLDAPREGDWGIRLDPKYIDLIADKFKTARVPVRWTNHASPDADARIDPIFLARVTAAIDAMLAKGMYVIVNVHHYNQLFGDALHPNEAAVPPEVVDARLFSIWAQLAEHFKGRPSRLIFELLNEPHGKLNAEAWNDLSRRLLEVVRRSNPDRVVMIGPISWNSARGLPSLKLPQDRNLIVAIHNYDPFLFTHQGISYLPMKPPAGVTCCNPVQQSEVLASLRAAKDWSTRNGYPVHLGEFGAYQAADMQSRVNYTRYVRDQAEKLGFSWAYWEFASTFGVYDPKSNAWRSDLLGALLN